MGQWCTFSSLAFSVDWLCYLCLGSVSFWELEKKILTNRQIDLKLRARIYLQITVNVALWGCSSWIISSDSMDDLVKWHRRNCRKILGVRLEDKNYTKDILSALGVPELDSIIHLRTLKLVRKVSVGGPNLEYLRKCVSGQAHGPQARGNFCSTTKSWMNSLEKGGIIDCAPKKEREAGKITLYELGRRFNNPETGPTVEENLGQREGAFKSKKGARAPHR